MRRTDGHVDTTPPDGAEDRVGVSEEDDGLRPEKSSFSGTSSEFIGRKPLPTAVQKRPVIFVLGDPGVGKTTVATRLLGSGAIRFAGKDLEGALAKWVQKRKWSDEVAEAPGLIVDGPCFLQRAPGKVKGLDQLLRQRTRDGHRTIVCEATDGGGLLAELIARVAIEERATIALRFPVGRGRRRFAVWVCDELGIDHKFARRVATLQPWTYARVTEALKKLKDA